MQDMPKLQDSKGHFFVKDENDEKNLRFGLRNLDDVLKALVPEAIV